MRIAVTGGSGFIGKYVLLVARKDLSADIRVIGSRRIGNQLQIGAQTFEYRYTDYSVDGLAGVLKGCDAVIHLAARKPVSKAARDDFSDFYGNVGIASSIFEACRGLGIQNIVNASTISVYGKDNALPFREGDQASPDGYYGLSKKMIDDLADYHNRRNGLAIKSLRIAHVIGDGVDERYMYKVFLRRALSGQPIVLWGKGEGRREYIYVKDVADAVVAGIAHNTGSGVFNVGSGSNTSHRELAELVVSVCESESEIVMDTSKHEDKSVDVMDVSRARDEFGWTANWGLKAAIADTLTYMV